MSGEQAGPGRRLTPEQEQRGAELFASGASEREVAKELGVGAGTAHRLRERLAAAQVPAEPQQPSDSQDSQQDTPDGDVLQAAETVITGEQMALLRQERDRLAGELETARGRAESSAAAKMRLEAERDALLAAGEDASGLRQRIHDAGADLGDWARAMQLIEGQLGEVDRRIAQLSSLQGLAGQRAELAAAVTAWQAAAAATGTRQRAAVEAVRDAAIEFTEAVADEDAARVRVEQLAAVVTQQALPLGEPGADVPPVASTALAVPPGEAYNGPGLALSRALRQASRGDVGQVAVHLGEAFGWLPPAADDHAAEWERYRQVTAEREAELERLRAAQQGGPVDKPDDHLEPVAFDVDGTPLNRFGDRLVPRGQLPHPMDVWRAPGIFGGASYGPGYRSGW